MAQHYSDPKRASEPTALPNVETFLAAVVACANCDNTNAVTDYPGTCACGATLTTEDRVSADAWWWWSCFPGCLPDSEPIGPFDSEADALADARESAE